MPLSWRRGENERGEAMHSHDRSLLANLGFADPDKKDPKHDWACQYLCQPEVGKKWLGLLTFPYLSDRQKATWNFKDFADLHFRTEVPISKGEGQYKTTIGFLDVLVTGRRLFVSRPLPELAALMEKIKKSGGRFDREGGWYNHGKRWQVVGGRHGLQREVDRLTPQIAAIFDDNPPASSSGPTPSDDSTWADSSDFCAFVEVKIAPTQTGDILRQVQLYGEYRECWRRVGGPALSLVVTAFPLQAADVATLKAAGVSHAKLGEAFEDYCARRRADPASTVINAEL
jgi:hypothetical protein